MGLRGSRRPTSHIQADSQDEQDQKVGPGGGGDSHGDCRDAGCPVGPDQLRVGFLQHLAELIHSPAKM